jgi:hypothetical protein
MPPRLASLVIAIMQVAALAVPIILSQPASAASAQLQSRSLQLSSSAIGTISTDNGGIAVPAGNGGNGQKVKYTFSFKLKSTQSIGSILIEFCNDPIPQANNCTNPTNFDAHNVSTIQSQTNFTGGAFSIDNTTDLRGSPYACSGASPGRTNCIAIKRASPGAETNTIDNNGGNVTATPAVTLSFGGTATDYITNPSDPASNNYPFFARIQTYTDTAYTTPGDYGSVAASTTQQINITAKVKEVLNFSVGNAAQLTTPTQLCTALNNTAGPTSTSGDIKLGDTNGVLSFTTSYDAHSYFRLSTNTNGGVGVYYSGDTLKNGSNQINPINPTPDYSRTNNSQFGLAIDNSDTQGGQGYSFTNLTAAANYANGNGGLAVGAGNAQFFFDPTSISTPVLLASAPGAVACDTGSVRYVGNISTATPAGIYTTTITYIATGTY